MNRRHLFIVLAVVLVVILVASTLFTRNANTPDADGAATANNLSEQADLPAGPVIDPTQAESGDAAETPAPAAPQ